MLIKYKGKVINLNKIHSFEKSYFPKCAVDLDETHPTIDFNPEGDREYLATFIFSSLEERDKAFERILEDYRWQRMQCTLD